MAHAWGSADEFHWSMAKNDHKMSPRVFMELSINTDDSRSMALNAHLLPCVVLNKTLRIHWHWNTNLADWMNEFESHSSL